MKKNRLNLHHPIEKKDINIIQSKDNNKVNIDNLISQEKEDPKYQ